MHARRGLGLVLVGLLCAAVPRAADACSCAGPNPACAALWHTTAVFAGRVSAIEPFSRPIDLGSGRTLSQRMLHVRLRVLEAFKGISGPDVTIDTGVGGGDCGFGFEVGGDYLVYAEGSRVTNELGTGICSPTKALNQASDDLAYLRGLSVPPAAYGVELTTQRDAAVTRILFGNDRGPHVFALIEGQRIDAGDLHIPDTTRLVRITGVVRDTDGTPVEGADVYLEGDSPNVSLVGRPITTARDGRFTFSAPALGYRLAAELRAPGTVPRLLRSGTVTVDPTHIAPIVLVIGR